MRTLWITATLLAGAIGVFALGCNTALGPQSEPPPVCSLPDSGAPCTCPGASVCGLEPGAVWFKCLDDGGWEKTDLSCTLGLGCRSSAECDAGQVCCGDPYTGSWGTQITSSSCQAASCSSDTVQLCVSSTECAHGGSSCGMSDLAYDAGSVLQCSP
jgi:hypothetical protein